MWFTKLNSNAFHATTPLVLIWPLLLHILIFASYYIPPQWRIDLETLVPDPHIKHFLMLKV